MDTKKLIALITSAVTAACIDTNLADEINWPDFPSPQQSETDLGPTAESDDVVLLRGDGGGPVEGIDDPPRLVPLSSCHPGEESFELTCLSAGPFAVALRFRTSEPARAEPVVKGWELDPRANEPQALHHLVLAVLAPAQVLTVEVNLEDTAGQTATVGPWEVETTALVAPVVITEVLFDPSGPEPDQEFVEILNVGSTDIALEGWTLADEGGQDPLPSNAPPGGYGLIIGPDYVPGLDQPPPPVEATVVSLAGAVGSAGLRNSGEALALYANDGRLVAISPPGEDTGTQGRSWARRSPWAPDDDPLNWEPHVRERCSPGAPNNEVTSR